MTRVWKVVIVAAWRRVLGAPPAEWYAGYVRWQARVWIPYLLGGIGLLCIIGRAVGALSKTTDHTDGDG